MDDDKLLLEMMDFWPLHISTEPQNIEQFFTEGYRLMVTEAVEDSLYLRGLPDRKVHPFAKRIYNCLFGQTLLNTLLQDPRVTDIKILTYNQIRLKCMGIRKPSRYYFHGKEQYLQFLEYLLLRNGLHLTNLHSMLSFYDASYRSEDILCFHVSSGRVNNINIPSLHLRRIPKKKKNLQELEQEGMLTPLASSQLREQVLKGSCILLTGPDITGQRTLMNALLDLIPHNRSALAIQESEELFSLSHPEILFQHTAPSSRSRNACDTGELMEYGRLLDSDYFILDELNQENAFAFWKASAKDCRCWASLPAPDAGQALTKLADYLCQETVTARDTVLDSFRRFSCILCLDQRKLTGMHAVLGWDSPEKQFRFQDLLA